MENNPIFALDIGTRSVNGILLNKEKGTYTLLDYCTLEHEVRSMHDGQIHQVEEVAKVIQHVKQKLEENYGPLHKVSVAAAGRSLKTVQAKAILELNQKPITDKETIKHLELSAVHAAQQKLANEDLNKDYSQYYCVGYSVLYYKIDHEPIGSLIDQSGLEASVEVIATFLPKVVVESLLAALSRANLDMDALTLEPIAAIHVLIPESMRRLNVALVDIGAGTSDIAITNKGTVVAYGMVPIAGDEVTEAISDQYLLDFPLAEQAKRDLVSKGETTVTDILGFETTVSYETVIQDVKSSIEKLTNSIAEEIYQLNGGVSPKAVMLVGGGSLTPDVSNLLAEKLQLPKNRVAIRGIDAIQSLQQTDNLPAGPSFVTPIGIAISATQNPVHYLTITVNEQVIRMFEMRQLSVGDCLVQAGIEIKKLYGKPGNASIVTVNGKELTIPGEFGESPTILLNGQTTTVESVVQNGDHITVKKGSDGKQATISLEELLGPKPTTTISYNREKASVPAHYVVNGEVKRNDYMVEDKDDIQIKYPETIEDFFLFTNRPIPQSKPMEIFVDGHKVLLSDGDSQILLNKQIASLQDPIKSSDQLLVTNNSQSTVHELLLKLEESYWHSIQVFFNGEPIRMQQQRLTIYRKGEELNEDSNLYHGDKLSINTREINPFIFQDVFRYIELDLTNRSGKFQLFKNEEETTFYDEVNEGDHLSIVFY